MRYAHTNLIALDWRRLAAFYTDLFDCVLAPPERDVSGDAIERMSGLPGAHLRGVHLRLPGHGEGGPTLEIFSYDSMIPKPVPAANLPGYGHLAFEVDDVAAKYDEVIRAGGSALGEIVRLERPGLPVLEMAYVQDPEGNIIEIQRWGDGK